MFIHLYKEEDMMMVGVCGCVYMKRMSYNGGWVQEVDHILIHIKRGV